MDSFSYHIKHLCRLSSFSLGSIAWFFCFRRGFVPYCFCKYHASSHWDLSCIHMLCEYAAEHVCVRVHVCLCVLRHACAECSCVPNLIFHKKMKSVLSCLREKQNKKSTGQISSPLHSSRWQIVIGGGSCQPSVSESVPVGLWASGSPDAPEGVFELLEEPDGKRAG